VALLWSDRRDWRGWLCFSRVSSVFCAAGHKPAQGRR
jgi:hypothetical protein